MDADRITTRVLDHIESGRLSQADAALSGAISKHPTHPGLCVAQALLFLRSGQVQHARRRAEALSQRPLHDPRTLHYLVSILQETCSWSALVRTYQLLQPTQNTRHMEENIIQAYIRMGDYATVQRLSTEMHRRYGGEPHFRVWMVQAILAQVAMQRCDDGATQTMQQAASLTPAAHAPLLLPLAARLLESTVLTGNELALPSVVTTYVDVLMQQEKYAAAVSFLCSCRGAHVGLMEARCEALTRVWRRQVGDATCRRRANALARWWWCRQPDNWTPFAIYMATLRPSPSSGAEQLAETSGGGVEHIVHAPPNNNNSNRESNRNTNRADDNNNNNNDDNAHGNHANSDDGKEEKSECREGGVCCEGTGQRCDEADTECAREEEWLELAGETAESRARIAVGNDDDWTEALALARRLMAEKESAAALGQRGICRGPCMAELALLSQRVANDEDDKRHSQERTRHPPWLSRSATTDSVMDTKHVVVHDDTKEGVKGAVEGNTACVCANDHYTRHEANAQNHACVRTWLDAALLRYVHRFALKPCCFLDVSTFLTRDAADAIYRWSRTRDGAESRNRALHTHISALNHDTNNNTNVDDKDNVNDSDNDADDDDDDTEDNTLERHHRRIMGLRCHVAMWGMSIHSQPPRAHMRALMRRCVRLYHAARPLNHALAWSEEGLCDGYMMVALNIVLHAFAAQLHAAQHSSCASSECPAAHVTQEASLQECQAGDVASTDALHDNVCHPSVSSSCYPSSCSHYAEAWDWLVTGLELTREMDRLLNNPAALLMLTCMAGRLGLCDTAGLHQLDLKSAQWDTMSHVGYWPLRRALELEETSRWDERAETQYYGRLERDTSLLRAKVFTYISWPAMRDVWAFEASQRDSLTRWLTAAHRVVDGLRGASASPRSVLQHLATTREAVTDLLTRFTAYARVCLCDEATDCAVDNGKGLQDSEETAANNCACKSNVMVDGREGCQTREDGAVTRIGCGCCGNTTKLGRRMCDNTDWRVIRSVVLGNIHSHKVRRMTDCLVAMPSYRERCRYLSRLLHSLALLYDVGARAASTLHPPLTSAAAAAAPVHSLLSLLSTDSLQLLPPHTDLSAKECERRVCDDDLPHAAICLPALECIAESLRLWLRSGSETSVPYTDTLAVYLTQLTNISVKPRQQQRQPHHQQQQMGESAFDAWAMSGADAWEQFLYPEAAILVALLRVTGLTLGSVLPVSAWSKDVHTALEVALGHYKSQRWGVAPVGSGGGGGGGHSWASSQTPYVQHLYAQKSRRVQKCIMGLMSDLELVGQRRR